MDIILNHGKFLVLKMKMNGKSSINKQTINQHRFECENKHKFYRYIRYIQDDSWRSDRKNNVYHVLNSLVQFQNEET